MSWNPTQNFLSDWETLMVWMVGYLAKTKVNDWRMDRLDDSMVVRQWLSFMPKHGRWMEVLNVLNILTHHESCIYSIYIYIYLYINLQHIQNPKVSQFPWNVCIYLPHFCVFFYDVLNGVNNSQSIGSECRPNINSSHASKNRHAKAPRQIVVNVKKKKRSTKSQHNLSQSHSKDVGTFLEWFWFLVSVYELIRAVYKVDEPPFISNIWTCHMSHVTCHMSSKWHIYIYIYYTTNGC